ncbi:MAG: hypothetical protein K6T65_14265 [Peptococcaceae bacterium]|nr:hypothetical protein [Peptococcaceae bacterium]
MRRTTPLITAGIILLAIISYEAWKVSVLTPPRQAVENYIRALAAGDVETALKSSSGSAAYAASRLRGSEITARVEEVSCSVAALGRGWARVLATVELTLQDGSVDVGWYSLDAVKTDKGWKVVSFREAGLELEGTGVFFTSQADIPAVKQVFQDYLNALAAGDWQGAAKYLAGPARRIQEAGTATLGKGSVINKAEALTTEPVWGKGKGMMVRFGYKVDGRDVSVIVELYRTGQGWKITRVLQQ